MKKLLLAIVAVITALTAAASVEVSNDFAPVFTNYNLSQLSAWTLSGPDKKPAENFSQYFPSYSAKTPVALITGESGIGIWTLSQYADGSASDTWVITPEFEVTSDSQMLSFYVESYGTDKTVSSSYEVLISESGTAKEDFTSLSKGSIAGSSSGASSISLALKKIGLSGYKGKKIHLAFVNKGNTVGIMGFSSIAVGSCYVSGYPDYLINGNVLLNDGETFSFPIKISTPVTVKGCKIDFTTSTGYNYSYENSNVTFRLTTQQEVTVSIPNLQLEEYQDYVVTITPNLAGGGSVVIKGAIIKASKEYDAVPVMEEGTGTWCGWCPFGAAALNYYHHKYNGENGAKKAIGIALHGPNLANDPMTIPSSISDYFDVWSNVSGMSGYPFIGVNRKFTLTPSPNPAGVGTILDRVFDEKAYSSIKINKVYFEPGVSDEMVADYSLTSSFNTSSVPVLLSAVVIENNVQGSSLSYNQESYLDGQGYNENYIRRNLGEDWVPYFEAYFNRSVVFFTQIQYDHVARAAYPSYYGEEVPGTMPGTPYNGRIEFKMPSNVMIEENTAVILLVTLPATGEIIAADELTYDNFTFESGIDKVEEKGVVSASMSDGILTINVDADSDVDVFSVDGTHLLSKKAYSGMNTYSVDAKGLVIVNIKGNASSRQFKFINK